MKLIIELMIMHVATIYVVIVGQIWWFGVLSLMSLFATVRGAKAKKTHPSLKGRDDIDRFWIP